MWSCADLVNRNGSCRGRLVASYTQASIKLNFGSSLVIFSFYHCGACEGTVVLCARAWLFRINPSDHLVQIDSRFPSSSSSSPLNSVHLGLRLLSLVPVTGCHSSVCQFSPTLICQISFVVEMSTAALPPSSSYFEHGYSRSTCCKARLSRCAVAVSIYCSRLLCHWNTY